MIEGQQSGRSGRFWGVFSAVAAIVAMIVAVWMDLATRWWSETVIISGIAAGLLTFVLTAFSIERWMDRRDHRNWLPVTRLALTDLLHTVCDDELSDIRRGRFVKRALEMPNPITDESLERLLDQVVEERDLITDSLARWASFLAASADVQMLMTHLAYLGEGLDTLRDVVLETENDQSDAQIQELENALRLYSEGMDLMIRELQIQIEKVTPVVRVAELSGIETTATSK